VGGICSSKNNRKSRVTVPLNIISKSQMGLNIWSTRDDRKSRVIIPLNILAKLPNE
jgi:hypothetical protein